MLFQEEADKDKLPYYKIGKYKIIDKIGKGAFGNVYKAEYNKKLFAIKVSNENKKNCRISHEIELYHHLKDLYLIPKIYYSGDLILNKERIEKACGGGYYLF